MGKYIIIFLLCFNISITIKAQKIVFTPQWCAQSQFAGFYAAHQQGFYENAGIGVDINYPNIAENPINRLKSGEADVINMNLMQALAYRASGLKIINVMQTSHISSMCIVSHFPIKGIESFSGRKIGLWAYINPSLINHIMSHLKINLDIIPFDGGVNLFLSKAIDAMIITSYNELYQLKQCGFNITSDNCIKLSDIGIDSPDDGIYVMEDYYINNKELIDKFVTATAKGWIWVRNNPEKALELVMQETHRNDSPTNRYIQENMLREILRLQAYSPDNRQQFRLSKNEFEKSLYGIFQDSSKKELFKYEEFVKP